MTRDLSHVNEGSVGQPTHSSHAHTDARSRLLATRTAPNIDTRNNKHSRARARRHARARRARERRDARAARGRRLAVARAAAPPPHVLAGERRGRRRPASFGFASFGFDHPNRQRRGRRGGGRRRRRRRRRWRGRRRRRRRRWRGRRRRRVARRAARRVGRRSSRSSGGCPRAAGGYVLTSLFVVVPTPDPHAPPAACSRQARRRRSSRARCASRPPRSSPRRGYLVVIISPLNNYE